MTKACAAAQEDADSLTPSRIDSLVREISSMANLDPTDATLIKFTNNAVIRLPRPGAVIRVAGSEITRRRIHGVIAAAELFHDNGIPAVTLWPGLHYPIRVGVHLATIWREVLDDGSTSSASDLARILRAIHSLEPVESPRLPDWSLPSGIRQRILIAPALDEELRDFLAREIDILEHALTDLDGIPPLSPSGIIHGDAHLGNLLATSDGGAVICDFDSTSIGPREWDLVPAAVGSLRFHYKPNVHLGLVAGYGTDVTTWPGFPTLRKLRELQLVTSVLPVLNDIPALRPQWEHRLNSYRSGDEDARWTPYAASS